MYNIEYDDFGPLKVLKLFFPKTNFKAVVIVHNTALGPSIGGVRISPTITTMEILRLARTMTLKNSIAGLPHGGGKAGILADPADPKLETYIRLLARAIKDLKDYIPGPDMGCNEKAMGWIHDEIGRAVGLPEEIGGIPLDKLGATGFGLTESAEVSAPYANLDLAKTRFIVQGFGSVGKAVAINFQKKGANLIAVSDLEGAIYNPDGFDIDELIKVSEETGSVTNLPKGKKVDKEEIFSLPCDILIPAACPDVINLNNVKQIRATMIIEGANIPITREAEAILHERKILVIPDFIANAGGVIMGAMEFAGRSVETAFTEISKRIKTNTALILKEAQETKRQPRLVAEKIARERVIKAMEYKML